MTDFFDDLEAQLVAAHPRRRRARALAAASTVAIVLAALVLAAGAAGLAMSVGGGDDGDGSGARPAGTPLAPLPETPCKVAILNGTTQPGLGRDVATMLERDGLPVVEVTDAPQPDNSTTYVVYRPDGRATALAVAARLHTTRVRPLAKGDPPFRKDAWVAAVLGPDARSGLAAAPAVPAHAIAAAFLRAGRVTGSASLSAGGLSVDVTGLAPGTYGVWVEDRYLGSATAGEGGEIHERLTPANSSALVGKKLQLVTREAATVASGTLVR